MPRAQKEVINQNDNSVDNKVCKIVVEKSQERDFSWNNAFLL